jgi:hypothetical protein
MHWNANFTEITLLQWAPTYLNQVLGVPLASLGKYLLAPALIEQVANVGAAAAESAMLARGISTLALRRAACVAASVTQALGMLLFGLARSPARVTGGGLGGLGVRGRGLGVGPRAGGHRTPRLVEPTAQRRAGLDT